MEEVYLKRQEDDTLSDIKIIDKQQKYYSIQIFSKPHLQRLPADGIFCQLFKQIRTQ